MFLHLPCWNLASCCHGDIKVKGVAPNLYPTVHLLLLQTSLCHPHRKTEWETHTLIYTHTERETQTHRNTYTETHTHFSPAHYLLNPLVTVRCIPLSGRYGANNMLELRKRLSPREVLVPSTRVVTQAVAWVNTAKLYPEPLASKGQGAALIGPACPINPTYHYA